MKRPDRFPSDDPREWLNRARSNHIERAAELTRYATAMRYPGIEDPVSTEAHAGAVAIAETVVRWAEEQV